MSGVMGNTSSNTNRISAQDKAILDMKNQRDKLHQYQQRITHLTALEVNIARTCLASGDKSRALLALRRKKYQESLLSKTDAQLAQLEQLVHSVEFALVQKDIVFGLQQGTQVLNEIHREMGGIEHVEKLMGENAEAVAYQREVSEMLGGRISNDDEDEVEDELEALEREVVGPVAAPNEQTALPDAPTTELKAKERAKARERQRAEERQAMLA